MICYADETLVVAEWETWRRTVGLAQAVVGYVVGEIQMVGMNIFAGKTEAMWLHTLPRHRRAPKLWIGIGDATVEVKEEMSYHGLTLDRAARCSDASPLRGDGALQDPIWAPV